MGSTDGLTSPRRLCRSGAVVTGVACGWLLLIGGGSFALVIGAFAVIMLGLDFLLPYTGSSRVDAERAFELSRRPCRRRPAWWRDRAGAPAGLVILSAPVAECGNRRPLGQQRISVNLIVGTADAERARDFGPGFAPPRWVRGRWELMWIASRRGIGMPPISVARVEGFYYVLDGHLRVSVARSLGAADLEARVTELTPTPLPF